MVFQALRAGATVEQVFAATKIDPWFLDQLVLLLEVAAEVRDAPELTAEMLRLAKRHGFSDAQIASVRHLSEEVVRGVRWALGIRPVFKTVDTCAAEFAALTPYHYSSYDDETEVQPRDRPAVLILGSGPNRIGQGIEFDYSCVHAAMALSADGYETIMVNCNPETVSTDYDTADRLYFEPLTCEDVLEVVHAERRRRSDRGSDRPARRSDAAGIWPRPSRTPACRSSAPARRPSTWPRNGERSGRCWPRRTCPLLGTAWRAPSPRRNGSPTTSAIPCSSGRATSSAAAGMEIVYDANTLAAYIDRATEVTPDHPVLVDQFLDDAVEIDVDAIYDGTELYLGGVMEHIEEAGIHSGDSACALPPITLGAEVVDRIRTSTEAIAARRRGPGLDQHPVRPGR